MVFKATAENDLEREEIDTADIERLFCTNDNLEIAENIFLKVM